MDRDNSGREMQVEVIQPLNQALKMDPHIYYFAQRADSSVPGKKGDGNYPLNLPSEEADHSTDFKPGIWYNMPIEKGDHMFWIGLWRSRKSFFATYDRLLDLYAGLPDGDK